MVADDVEEVDSDVSVEINKNDWCLYVFYILCLWIYEVIYIQIVNS